MSLSPVKRTLRVTADDFGFTSGVTDGILEAHEKGIVTPTSLMAGGLDFDRSVNRARTHPSLGVGLHLTLTVLAGLIIAPLWIVGLSCWTIRRRRK